MTTYPGKIPPIVEILFVASLVVRGCLAFGLGPGFDEAYYYSYATHPALSFFDHPPVVGWLAGLGPFLTGVVSPCTIRLGAVVLFSLTGLLVYRLVFDLADGKSAVIGYGIVTTAPLFLLGAGTMILPDAGLSFFWVATLLVLVRAIRSPDSLWLWIGAGLLAGGALLSKYHGAFLLLCLGCYIILFRRDLIRKPGPYVYGILALLVFSPVLIWNAQHQWISFTFQSSRAVSTQIKPIWFLRGIIGQMAYLTPMIMIPLVWVGVGTFKRAFVGKDEASQLYLVFGMLPVLFFNLIAFVKPILPHWTLPGFLVLVFPLAQAIARRLSDRSRTKGVTRWYMIGTAGVTGILLAMAFAHTNWGIIRLDKMAERGWVSRKAFTEDPTLDVHGWSEVGDYFELKNLNRDSTFLIGHKWFTAGQLALATGGKRDVVCFNSKDPRGFGIWNKEIATIGKDGYFVCSNRYKRDPHAEYGEYFESIDEPDSLLVYRGGVASKTMYIYRCRNMIKPYSVREY